MTTWSVPKRQQKEPEHELPTEAELRDVSDLELIAGVLAQNGHKKMAEQLIYVRDQRDKLRDEWEAECEALAAEVMFEGDQG